MRRQTTYFEEIDGVECKLMFEPVDTYSPKLTATIGDKRVYAYLTYDARFDYDSLMGDFMGKMYSFHRHAGRDDHREGMRALGNTVDGEMDIDAVWEKHEEEAIDRYIKEVRKHYELSEVSEHLNPDEPYEDWDQAEDDLRSDARGAYGWSYVEFEDAMESVLSEMWNEPAYFPGDKYARLLACYEHGSQHWSLSGQGMQCRWDTSNQAGVWVPDGYLRKEIESHPEAERDAKTNEYCRQFLETHNDIINGNVYGCVVEVFDDQGEQIAEDACWGFIGDYAEQALKSEFFEPTCEELRKEVAETNELEFKDLCES